MTRRDRLEQIASGSCHDIVCDDCPIADWHRNTKDFPVPARKDHDLPKGIVEKAKEVLLDEQIEEFLKDD